MLSDFNDYNSNYIFDIEYHSSTNSILHIELKSAKQKKITYHGIFMRSIKIHVCQMARFEIYLR